MKLKSLSVLSLCLLLNNTNAIAGVLDPDCDVGDAAKSSAMKANVGVGGRCTAKEVAKDAVGVEKKGPVEKRRKNDDGLAKRAAKKAID